MVLTIVRHWAVWQKYKRTNRFTVDVSPNASCYKHKPATWYEDGYYYTKHNQWMDVHQELVINHINSAQAQF